VSETGTPKSSRFKRGVIDAILCLALLVAGSGEAVAHTTAQTTSGLTATATATAPRPEKPSTAVPLDSVWREFRSAELSLESPIPLGLRPELAQRTLEGAKQPLLSAVENLGGESQQGLFSVQVVRWEYKPGFAVDISAAASAGAEGAAAAIGQPTPTPSLARRTVSGRKAIRADWSATRGDSTVYWLSLFVLDGEHFWQVQTVMGTEPDRAIAQRILDSVKLGP
jgi:hypothetical protein